MHLKMLVMFETETYFRMHNKKLTFRSRLLSFKYALEGLAHLIKNEPNAQLHLAATIVVIALGIIRHLHTMKWIAITIAIAIVWITEAINTAIETLCNRYCNNEYDPFVKIVKDVSAAAVLISSIMSVIIALGVFLFS